MSDEVHFSIEFVVPPEQTIDLAKQYLESSDIDKKIVAKALIDVTEVTSRTRDAYGRQEDLNLSDYFDHWFGDAIESAQRILVSSDADAQRLASALISQEQAIVRSKESFLNGAKRLGNHGS